MNGETDTWQCDECGLRIDIPGGADPAHFYTCARCHGGHFTKVPAPGEHPFDARTLTTARTAKRVRALLIEHFPHEPLDTLATALAYELASIVATASATDAEAIAVLRAFAAEGENQVSTFGVGHPHP